MKFHEKLKALRIEKGLTQDELADKLYISRQSVSKWEQGINEPSIDTLKQICLIFDVGISELLDDDKEVVVSREEKQKNLLKKLYLSNVALVIFSILVTFIILRAMKENVPMHYNIHGEVTRYGSKWEFLMIPSLSLVFLAISSFYRFHIAKNIRTLKKTVTLIQVIFVIFQVLLLIAFSVLGLSDAKNLLDDIAQILTGFMLSLVIVLSIFTLPTFNKKRNEFFGFRTQFTLANDSAWKKVNKFQSISALIFSSLSYLILVVSFAQWNIYLLGAIILSLIPTIVYHEVLKRKLKNSI